MRDERKWEEGKRNIPALVESRCFCSLVTVVSFWFSSLVSFLRSSIRRSMSVCSFCSCRARCYVEDIFNLVQKYIGI